jgi:uncharacterized membrane protein YuzA (DUF378 family)
LKTLLLTTKSSNKKESIMKTFNIICLTLTIIGAIVWGIVGFFNFNIVDALFGTGSWFSRIIYALVGLSGLYLISFYSRLCNSDN